ncbi:MAG: hypothetical protein H0V17_36150, partial [Deltaproteobacteria bacterium]|nr:hypothetical protein [Deltaproteobacteria bacterium]
MAIGVFLLMASWNGVRSAAAFAIVATLASVMAATAYWLSAAAGAAVMRGAVVIGLVFASRVASADLMNNDAIHAHVDAMLARDEIARLDEKGRRALRADRVTLS